MTCQSMMVGGDGRQAYTFTRVPAVAAVVEQQTAATRAVGPPRARRSVLVQRKTFPCGFWVGWGKGGCWYEFVDVVGDDRLHQTIPKHTCSPAPHARSRRGLGEVVEDETCLLYVHVCVCASVIRRTTHPFHPFPTTRTTHLRTSASSSPSSCNPASSTSRVGVPCATGGIEPGT